jgi:hypothetical protein
VAGFTDEDDLEGAGSQSPLSPGIWELGLGRARVLSQIGRDDAADRWYAGDTGPDSAMAKNAPLSCLTCGFLMPMGGAFGQMFAVCANVMAPADGRVVALDYGCGAHSEVQVDEVLAEGIVADGVLADEILADDLLREGEGDGEERPGGELVSESYASAVEETVLDARDLDARVLNARVLDARVLDALALDDDLVEDAIEDLDGTVPVDAVEGLILDDAGEQDDPSADDEPTDSSAPVAAAAPKRPRGRGWLRGRSS